MGTTPLHYLDNQFDNVTKKSYKLMNIINADHLAKLQAQQSEPDIAALLARTILPHDDYNTAYSNWFSANGIYKGETNRVNGYLDELRSTKIKQWDIQIQQAYIAGTPDYIALLPNGRTPFQTGGMDARVSQLQALAQRLAAYPILSATTNDVLAFYTMLTAARVIQQEKEGLANNASALVEVARKNIALMMYRNLGFLMDKYASNTQLITNFWDISLLSSGGSVTTPVTTVITAITSIQTITIDFIAISPAGGTLLISYGDGTTETIVISGGGTYTTISHTYTTAGPHTITISGELISIGELRVINNELISLVFPDTAWLRNITAGNNQLSTFTIPNTYTGLMIVNLANNHITADSINNMLITINGFGTSGGTIHLEGGTNAAPTAAGITAMNALIARGWTVVTN